MDLNDELLTKLNLFEFIEFQREIDCLSFLENRKKSDNATFVVWNLFVENENGNDVEKNKDLCRYIHKNKQCSPSPNNCIYCYRYFCIVCGFGVLGMYSKCCNKNCISSYKEHDLLNMYDKNES